MSFRKTCSLWLCAVVALVPAARAGDDPPPAWHAPLIQAVRIPAGVRAGVYAPEHEEWVIVRPGRWEIAKPSLPPGGAAASAGPVLPRTDPPREHITLKGAMRLRQALEMIARSRGLALSVGAGVEDREVSVHIDGAAFDVAMSILLGPLGYGHTVDGPRLIVMAQDTRSLRIDLPPVTQAFDTTTTNESSSAASGALTAGTTGHQERTRLGARVVVANAVDRLSYWQDIEANIRGLLSPSGKVTFNRSGGMALVTDAPPLLDKVARLVDEINRRSARQITVDVKVVEVELAREHRLGIDWSLLASGSLLRKVSLTTNFASENMASGNVLTFSSRADKDGSGDTSSGIKEVLKALESFGKVEVVSQPRIMMLNNAVASIQVGETRSYVESTDIETTSSGATIATASLNEVHGGVTLQIMGSIAGDDIFLNVTPVVSSIDDIRTITLGGGARLEAPDTSMKTMSTMVKVSPERTVAIGGLITRSRTREQHGVPFICRIPVLGKAFSYEVRRERRTELVVFLTPRGS